MTNINARCVWICNSLLIITTCVNFSCVLSDANVNTSDAFIFSDDNKSVFVDLYYDFGKQTLFVTLHLVLHWQQLNQKLKI